MRTFLLTFVVLILSSVQAFADSPAIYTSWKNNLAISGYDPVSFFSGKPNEGKPEYSYEHQGAEWRFSTRGNLELFKTNPDAFLPQYGGYCAWALAKGKLAKGSPKHWAVEDGKLYVNFNARIKRRWDKDIIGFIEQADQRWPDILND